MSIFSRVIFGIQLFSDVGAEIRDPVGAWLSVGLIRNQFKTVCLFLCLLLLFGENLALVHQN